MLKDYQIGIVNVVPVTPLTNGNTNPLEYSVVKSPAISHEMGCGLYKSSLVVFT